jgi:CubicO group peptidase (beta-lactamase class C family)
MHEIMAGYVERGEIPGLVILVSRRGEVFVDAIGTKAIGDNDHAKRDTIFRISSMTRPRWVQNLLPSATFESSLDC